MTHLVGCKTRSSVRKKRESSEKRRSRFGMGAKVGVSEHQTASTSAAVPPNQTEPKRFERFRNSLDYWRKSFFGGCNFIKIKAQHR